MGLNGTECGECMENPCPAGRCSLPVQLNSIVRRFDGSPVALAGSLWALNSQNEVTNVLGAYAEYWQPWAHVVDESGLPVPLTFLPNITLEI